LPWTVAPHGPPGKSDGNTPRIPRGLRII